MMPRRRFLPCLPLALALLALLALPVRADKVATVAAHSDEMTVMGHTTPASDDTYEYWFGADALRYDMGDQSMVLHAADRKVFLLDHERRQYVEFDLPVTAEQLVGADAAGAMAQMMNAMQPKLTVTASDRTGSFAGVHCRYQNVDLSIMVMKSTSEVCVTEEVPFDYSRYRELAEAQAGIFQNQSWVKELQGFPLRTDTTVTVMGKASRSWQELRSIEDREAPAGHYQVPAGYTKTAFSPELTAGK